jgi:hypothetical protein
MKKFLAILLIALMFVLAACGDGAASETPDNNDSGNPIIDAFEESYGTINGTYSFVDGERIVSYTFSGNAYAFKMIMDGETVLEDSGTYEIEGNVFRFTDSQDNIEELEFALEGSTLTLVGAWFFDDLVLEKE